MKFHISIVLVSIFSNTVHIEGVKSRRHLCDKYTNKIIYCEGPILKMVQESNIFEDDKTFVDMPMKRDLYTIYQDYLTNLIDKNVNKRQLKEFLSRNFESPGAEYEIWEPEDWREYPSAFWNIDDPEYRKWAHDLNKMWPSLTRKIKDAVKINQDKYSLIYLPYPVVVSGGRTRELRYWDSYWIVKGLLHCGMYNTAKGILENFFYLVKKHQHVPLGNRIYYLGRAQPPLLIYMVKDYVEATGDYDMIYYNIQEIEFEIRQWMTFCKNESRNIGGKEYSLKCYFNQNVTGPRPEAYNIDTQLAKRLNSDDLQTQFYYFQNAASESVWDLSTRWLDTMKYDLDENLTNFGPMESNMIHKYLAVDLHSIFYGYLQLLINYNEIANNLRSQSKLHEMSAYIIKLERKKFWNEQQGYWFDFDDTTYEQRRWYYLSGILPLYTDAYDKDRDNIFERVVEYLKSHNLLDYVGGVPVSLFHSSEQWDYPNVWPSYQYFLIMGLRKSPRQEDKDLAKEIARKFLESTYQAYLTTGLMFDKYDANKFGGEGSGGDYSSQFGYGPTNGMILDLLITYGTELYRYDVVPRAGLTHAPKASAGRFYIRYALLFMLSLIVMYFKLRTI